MRCMKCGKEIAEQQAFCEDCLSEMEKHPVKPNIIVQLPPRNDAPTVKKKSHRHKERKQEDLLRQQRLIIRCLCAGLAVAVAAFALVAVMLLKLMGQRDAAPSIGQNYDTFSEN